MAWMDVEQAVEYLSFPSAKAIYEAVRRGQIPAHRLGRRLRFRTDELDRVLDAGRTWVAWEQDPACSLK